MVKVLTSLFIAFGLLTQVYAGDVQPEVKKVCVDTIGKDGKPVTGKDGKPQQTCKDVKVHKKLEGTKVPEKK
jgi:hypothetical protein